MPEKIGDASKHVIYKRIRADIITGRKKPGERLSIDILKEEFGTSVTPVRDALQMLSHEDLVTIKPRSGYYVTLVSLKELTDMIEFRQILELAAVERAAQKINGEQIAILENVHAGYTNDDDETYSRYTEENQNFHYLVAKASGNDELARQIKHLHDRLARFVVIVRSGKHMIDIHGRLIKKLKAHDPAGAKKTLLKELDEARTAIMEKIMQEEAASWHLGTWK
ncbi:MAG: GntR family transcriptional regulator [Desulfobacula sp.]|uniref:GntR family transcriptional regulator n=1 Tax=Desulfobacula sp. TaxID=2593537 RepID=UPI0025C5991F|nr:GntR family transcriptional regulator [Desulfobacula sp.]MCD4719536.1 GntR family transcriptional regulator [Desulfobacula sp.]